MSHDKKRKSFLIPVLGGLLLLAGLSGLFWGQEQECVEFTNAYIENFDTTTYKDHLNCSIANWPPGPISLNFLGSNFRITEPAGMGAKIYVCDAGDFDGDGYPDLMGLDIANNYRLILVRNKYVDDDGDGEDDDGIIFQIDPTKVFGTGFTVGPASITVADYNKDGLLDFFFYKNLTDSFSYSGFVAAMFINIGTPTDPNFNPYTVSPSLNFTQKFQNAGVYCNWAADHLCSNDIDGDGDTDLLVISQDKIFVIRNPGQADFSLDNFTISELNYDARTGFVTGCGGSSVDAGDFDNDGDIDVIGGSVNDYAYLVYYENDGMGAFTRKTVPIVDPYCKGTVATCVADFNNDGWLDIFAGTDKWNIPNNNAHIWFQKNMRVQPAEFQWRCLADCQPVLPDPHDVDMSASLDYDQDGDVDVILADANHSGNYYLIINDLAAVYALYGVAQSTNLSTELNPQLHAITKISITNLEQRVKGGDPTGLAIEYYVSNNNGRDWEFYARFEGGQIHNETNLPVHSFSNYGSQFKWKAILTATEDEMEEYEDASFETPLINEISFQITYVERREYSRSSTVATSIIDLSGQDRKLIIGGTYYFPGWQGHLRAYDVTSMTPVNDPYSVLRTVTRSDLSQASGREIVATGTEIFWDAGELLDARSPGDRTIYTAVLSDGTLARLDFTAGNVAILDDYLLDPNNDNAGLINFVRGQDRYWKLGDIDHSTPVVVGPPSGNASQMGTGYGAFAQTWQDRRKVLYVGANDGMIHCFDVQTGAELWGFVPYNLLPKLKSMWPVDAATGERYFARDVFVDGSPVSADVLINGFWRTILLCGQGKGKGGSVAGGTNYYFALDITDPQNPQPLWEFTDATMGESWSVPAIGKVSVEGDAKWVAFMGSGYDNVPGQAVGNVFYAVTLDDGVKFWSYAASEVDTSADFANIQNTIPASPSLIDMNSDVFADRVYFADLDGRVYRVDVSQPFEVNGPHTSWDDVVTVIYEDSHNYPIITRPESWINILSGMSAPRIFFGTGGDDSAPASRTYSFVSLIDEETPVVEWFLGDPLETGIPEIKAVGSLETGEKVWADPVASDFIVYFSSLKGSIENVDPCVNLADIGKLYGRYIQRALAGVSIGGTAFKAQGTGTSQESLTLASKSRTAVTVGAREETGGNIKKRDVYIQEYDSTIQKIEQPVGSLLKVKGWREVYRIVR